MMQESPKSPMPDMKEDFSQISSKKAILQKIIKIDELPDPVALYGTDTESEDPKPYQPIK